MNLGLGIDAGGTYTDAVMLDMDSNEVISKAKALTTRPDYDRGIAAAIRQMHIEKPEQISMVALSTTLATNAIVENQGGRVALILIGFRQESVHDLMQRTPSALIRGNHDIKGREIEPLDIENARKAIAELAGEVDVFAVCSYMGVRNPEHEKVVLHLVQKETNLPAMAAHELTDALNARERATTVYFNARLVPLVIDLMKAVDEVLTSFGIDAPLHVVKSDGSLMAREAALKRPVETVLSGPVASIAGARVLTGKKDAVVVDMGGTTTDVAVLKEGRPRLHRDGTRIAGYHTTINTLDIHTCGLGGDSEISWQRKGTFTVGPRRVLPICYIAQHYPEIRSELELWASGEFSHPDANLLPPVEFFLLADSTEPANNLSPRRRQIVDILRQRPASRFEIAHQLDYPYPSLLRLTDLEERNLIVRAGLTPTDYLNASGKAEIWDATASRMAFSIFSARLGTEIETFIQQVERRIQLQLATAILHQLFADNPDSKWTNVDVSGDSLAGTILQQILNHQDDGPVRFDLTLMTPIVGVGAPIASYLPYVVQALGGDFEIPAHHEVANAIGAITGQIRYSAKAIIRPEFEGGLVVYGPEGPRHFAYHRDALEYAQRILEQDVRNRSEQFGAEEIQVKIDIHDSRVRAADDTEVESSLYLETIVTATATGRPETR